jgi:hypothetical protein
MGLPVSVLDQGLRAGADAVIQSKSKELSHGRSGLSSC